MESVIEPLLYESHMHTPLCKHAVGEPEEYAARYGHRWGCFSLHQYRYRDAILAAWVSRLGEILCTEGELERCRQRFLTPNELVEVQRQEAEAF